jgi:hypothetical protein
VRKHFLALALYSAEAFVLSSEARSQEIITLEFRALLTHAITLSSHGGR